MLQVLRLVRRGWSNKKIYDWIEEHWEINKHSAWKYVHDAYLILGEHSDDKIENMKNIQSERIEDILSTALKKNDTNTALRALEMLNKLYSLYIEKNEVDVQVNDIKFEFGETQE